MDDEFSVWLFLADGTHMPEKRWVDDKTAMRCFNDCIQRPAAKVGIIQKVIITDGGDFTNAQWEHGKGITYPPPH